MRPSSSAIDLWIHRVRALTNSAKQKTVPVQRGDDLCKPFCFKLRASTGVFERWGHRLLTLTFGFRKNKLWQIQPNKKQSRCNVATGTVKGNESDIQTKHVSLLWQTLHSDAWLHSHNRPYFQDGYQGWIPDGDIVEVIHHNRTGENCCISP